MSGRGSVQIISTRAGASGSETPSIPASRPVWGPAAMTSESVPNGPRSVSTVVTRPAERPTWRRGSHARAEHRRAAPAGGHALGPARAGGREPGAPPPPLPAAAPPAAALATGTTPPNPPRAGQQQEIWQQPGLVP